jgi:MFS family permease
MDSRHEPKGAPSDRAIPRNYGIWGMLIGSRSMERREMTRIMLEGALNGIGFVIGSAIVGWIVSFFFLHIWAFFALPIIGLVLWLCLKGRRALKARLERVKLKEFARALRSSAVGGGSHA